MTDPNIADLVGRTFERDGLRVKIDWFFGDMPMAGIVMDGRNITRVHCPFLVAWLAGAVEVKENENGV